MVIMNMLRNYYQCIVTKAIALILCGLFISGCVTSRLWDKESYEETISQFAINPIDNSLVIIGENYHYLFGKQSAPVELLDWVKRREIKASFDRFTLKNHDIKGKYHLSIDKTNLNKNETIWLSNLGFSDNETHFKKSYFIEGTRYKAAPEFTELPNKLNHNYSIYVDKQHTSADIIINVALTPLAVASDGITIVFGTAGLTAALISIYPLYLTGNQAP